MLRRLREFPWRAQAAAIKAGRSTRTLLVVEGCGEDVGAMAVDFGKEPPELVFFEVVRSLRGRGIGRRALLLLLGRLAEEGHDQLMVQTGRPSIYFGMGFRCQIVGRSGVLIPTDSPLMSQPVSDFDLVLVHAPEYAWHDTYDAPEQPDRLSVTIEHLERSGLLAQLRLVAPRYATVEEVTKIHSSEYVASVAEASAQGRPLGPNNPTCAHTFDIARLSFGGALLAGDRIEAWRRAFVLCRPPGHHAVADQAMGFCFFNNMAGLALLLYERGYRPMVIDWDAHHGNGTQELLYRLPILFVSIHQRDLFPGTGRPQDRGAGAGLGYNVNLPVPPLSGDERYFAAFGEVVGLAEEYRPDVILVSAGQDGHRCDRLSGLMLSDHAYWRMGAMVRELAERLAGGRLVLLLEGGYNLETLGRLNELVIRGVLGLEPLRARLPPTCLSVSAP